MTTRIPARRLTVDHHGLHITVVRRGGARTEGRLTDTLIGDRRIELWIDGVRLQLAGSTTVELRR